MSKRLKLLLATSLIFHGLLLLAHIVMRQCLMLELMIRVIHQLLLIDTNQWTHSSNAQLSIYYADSKTLAQSYNKMVDPSVQIIKDHGRLVAKLTLLNMDCGSNFKLKIKGK